VLFLIVYVLVSLNTTDHVIEKKYISSKGADMGNHGAGVAVEVTLHRFLTMGDRLFSLRFGPA
jgi:hypothetical protein